MLYVAMLNVIKLSVIMLSVVTLSVGMLNVVTPQNRLVCLTVQALLGL